ncbi:MAG: hypothetical protein R6V54_05690 [Desulfobacteraceae bacterium]
MPLHSTGSKRQESTIAGTTDESSDDLGASMYRAEINSLRIEKLGNRVTIISVIIPCLIGAILVFSYLDIKERMVSVQDTGQSEVKTITKEFEEKLNGMNVDLARIDHSLETELPGIKKRMKALEGEIATISTKKADKQELQARLDKMDTRMGENANQYKTLVNIIDRTNNETISIINDVAKKLKKKRAELKGSVETRIEGLASSIRVKVNEAVEKKLSRLSDFDSRLSDFQKNLASYEQEIALARKEISIAEKKIEALGEQSVTTGAMAKKLEALESRLEKKINSLDLESSSTTESRVMKPSPELKEKSKGSTGTQLDLTKPGNISEKNLNE